MSTWAASPGCLSSACAVYPCPVTVGLTYGGQRRAVIVVAAATVQVRRVRRGCSSVVCMAPEEEKMTRRSPLDFPIGKILPLQRRAISCLDLQPEWERPKPGRRPDIFPKFSPMKTPLPTPLPADPPEEDEEEEEKKEEEEEEKQEEDPDQKPEKEI